MHFCQAAVFALWFSYRDKPKLWKPVLICICAALGFFDKFNFIWQLLFVVNLQNVGDTFLVLDARLSPEIYSLSQYINEHGLEAQSVVRLIGAAQPASCTRTQGNAAADARLLAGFPKPGKGNQER